MLVNGTETAELDDDLFAAGFDEAASGKEPDPTPAASPDASTDEPPAEATPAAVPEPADAAAAPVETPPALDTTKIVADAVAAAIAATKTAAPVVEEPAAPAGPTAEELAAEEQFRKDWPEHAAREDRLKAEVSDLKKMLTETVELLKGQIAPVIAATNQTAEERHRATIVAAHPDVEAIVPEVIKWVATQPKILQPQYNAVLEQGTAADVIELFDIYKKAVGTTPPADTPTAEELAAKAAEDAKKKEQEERLNRMKTPQSLRSSVSAEEDADDFDSAFDAEAKKIKIAV